MRHFLATRQRHLVDPEHSASAQANTVLVTGVPRKFLDEQVLAQLFSHLPGGAKAIWLNRYMCLPRSVQTLTDGAMCVVISRTCRSSTNAV